MGDSSNLTEALLFCGRRASAGIPESVLSRAREVAEFEDRGEPIQPVMDERQGLGGGPLTLASSEVGNLDHDVRGGIAPSYAFVSALKL